MTLKTALKLIPCGAVWLALGCLLFLPAGPATANNIRVTNVGLTKQDTVTKTVNVVFDLSWENSWRDVENWDAAWVFIKFRAPGSSVWEHALLATNSASHKLPASATNSAVPDGMGAFIYPAANHIGPVNYASIKLKWNYGENGQDFATGAVVEVSVHAIEMVLIPQGSFYLGSGGSEPGHFYQYTDGLQSTKPFLVSSTNAINITNSVGNLYYTSTTYGGDQQGILSNSFPNGYAAFYCMKYEITQGQYADFLNKLTTAQANQRFPNKNGSTRHTLTRNALNYYSADAPDRACNYLSWADGCAYADWAALRPMTELEFEKACRGAAYPVANEFAWGNTIAIKITGESGTVGSGMEIAIPANANCRDPGWDQGPYRVGIFAARANTTRALSGAGYYGVMELSGNMVERCVIVGNDTGRSFTGLHGDGMLTNAAGEADVIDWPAKNAVGAGVRGNNGITGNASSEGTSTAPISDRSFSNFICLDRRGTFGWRGVRTAP